MKFGQAADLALNMIKLCPCIMNLLTVFYSWSIHELVLAVLLNEITVFGFIILF